MEMMMSEYAPVIENYYDRKFKQALGKSFVDVPINISLVQQGREVVFSIKLNQSITFIDDDPSLGLGLKCGCLFLKELANTYGKKFEFLWPRFLVYPEGPTMEIKVWMRPRADKKGEPK